MQARGFDSGGAPFPQAGGNWIYEPHESDEAGHPVYGYHGGATTYVPGAEAGIAQQLPPPSGFGGGLGNQDKGMQIPYHSSGGGIPSFDGGGSPSNKGGVDTTTGRMYPFPLYTGEDADDRDAVFRHNAPFATRGPYQTPLSPAEERAFRTWVTQNHVLFNPNDPKSDYDMRGYWKDTKGAPGAFYSDRYKTPYDTDFSNESKYATPNSPFRWRDPATLMDTRDGSVIFFDPYHYQSDSTNPAASQPSPIAPMDTPGHHGGGAIPGFDGGGDIASPEPEPSGAWDIRKIPPGERVPGTHQKIEAGENIYGAFDPATGKAVGSLSYTPRADGSLYVDMVKTIPEYRGKGVAKALLEQMVADNPGHSLDPGILTESGQGLTDHLLETNPEYKDMLVGPKGAGDAGALAPAAGRTLGVLGDVVGAAGVPMMIDQTQQAISGAPQGAQGPMTVGAAGTLGTAAAAAGAAGTGIPLAGVLGIGAAGAGALLGASTAFGAATGQESDRTPGVTYGPHGEVLAAGPRAPGAPGPAAPTAPGSGYGEHWHMEVRHADGSISQLPLHLVTSSGGESHWTADVQLRPGDQAFMVHD